MSSGGGGGGGLIPGSPSLPTPLYVIDVRPELRMLGINWKERAKKWLE